MYDLRLTESGDIDVEVEEAVSTYKISFSLVDFNRQRVRFIIAPPSVKRKGDGAQRVLFKLSGDMAEYKVQDKSIADLQEAIQAIRIALRTEKNNVHNLDIGSYAYQLHHTLYIMKRDLEDIRAYMQEVVNTILPEAVVTVKYADDEAAGYFRYQAVKVHIDYNGNQLDEFVF